MHSCSIVAAGVLLILVFATEARACSCATPEVSELLRTRDAAVVGRLTEVSPAATAFKSDYVYELLDVFRGRRRLEPGQRVTVRSSGGEASCGLPATTGRRYGLFLDRIGGHWTSNLCVVVSPREMRKAAADRGFEWRLDWACG